jgi:hypothetical protein
MLNDKYGGEHSTNSKAAVSAFESAVYAVAAHRPIGDSVQRTLQFDPNLIAAHALLGFGNILLGKAENAAAAGSLLSRSVQLLSQCDSGSASERALVEALQLAEGGSLKAAALRFEAHLKSQPNDFLALKLSHALRFMSGQASEMLTLTSQALGSWSSSNAGYGFVLGCHAFGLEECGQFGAAERFGREAYAHERSDAWGLHAVSHVMEMSRRVDEGAAWLEKTRPDWSGCNNFAYHLGWHLALFRLEQGQTDAVLNVYDKDIRPSKTDDFRDMANATSILWRMELEGVAVGNRWDELQEVAHKRRLDTTYVFGSLHYLLALVASGDSQGATELLEEMRKISVSKSFDQSLVAAEVGVPLAETIIAMGDRRAYQFDLAKIAAKLPIIGGSHAQRDVFLRTLLIAAAESNDHTSLLAINRIRHSLRSTDRFMSVIENRMQNPSGDKSYLSSNLMAS